MLFATLVLLGISLGLLIAVAILKARVGADPDEAVYAIWAHTPPALAIECVPLNVCTPLIVAGGALWRVVHCDLLQVRNCERLLGLVGRSLTPDERGLCVRAYATGWGAAASGVTVGINLLLKFVITTMTSTEGLDTNTEYGTCPPHTNPLP